MGNKLATPSQAALQSDYYLHDLPGNIVCKEAVVVATGRFLKTLKCFTDHGLIIVKVYLKRDAALNLSVSVGFRSVSGMSHTS